jgi:hypothetical protein
MPNKTNWLNDIFVSELAYVYQAALLCEECGEAVVKELKKEGRKDTGDSDDFPQGPVREGGGEADSPQHCDMNERCLCAVQVPGGKKIGCPLGNPLTNDGQKYVAETVAKNTLAKSAHQRAIGRLWRLLYDHLKPDHLVRVVADRLPANLGTLLDVLPQTITTRVPPEFYTDLDHVYGVAIDVDALTLWRAEIASDGSFEDLRTVLLPPSEGVGRTVEDALEEAWRDGAWD